ncbi:hypothetical protein MKD38_06205 [Cupriavidus sp. WGlv3]|uniref:hypothetical protein n=1 Tax=Cupriavidus sp. WGlv3 TaxID=2919924 RepID=UPI002091AFB7|nr:hypothetical protein [Cupriavidus sp. WGlv3]MCO4861254.1 hypothetical protein [Cupriavidus sp. WGlv3]
MARASRRKQREQQFDLLKIFGGLFLVAAALIGVVYVTLTKEKGVDKATLCPANGPTGHVVLLVDQTDPFNFVQKRAFEAELQTLVLRRTPKGSLLSVYVLGEDFTLNAEPLVELCNPGSGEDKSALTSNLTRLRKQYEERFVQPLMQQSEKLVSATPAKKSPIFEMLQLIGINAFRKHDIQGERRLIVVSDMLHNTPEFSMYKGLPDFDAFTDTAYGRKAQADLSGVEVELDYLVNDPKIQTRRNLSFWEAYFNKARARVVSARPLEG